MIDDSQKEKIFQADLANIVRKTKAGKPLTKAEREIIAAAAERKTRSVGRPRAVAPSFPIYDSIAAAAAGSGIPEPVFKQAKKNGCPAFRSNRVDFRLFLEWYFTREHGEIDWVQEREKWTAKREKIKHDKEASAVMEKEIIRSDSQAALATLFGELDRLFCNELPARLKGRDELTIRAESIAQIETLKTNLREKFATIGARHAQDKTAKA